MVKLYFSRFKASALFFALILSAHRSSLAQSVPVFVKESDDGFVLVVDGKNFMVKGMNWDYIPIGSNPVNANFWKKSDALIRTGLDAEMALLKAMNVNAIRHYSDIPPKWIAYIYEKYGIYTMLNHSFGRYGVTLDTTYQSSTDYSSPATQKVLLSQITALVKAYKNTPGLLLYLLGNENNYGLFWEGSESEDFPGDDRKQQIGENRARPMYKLMNEAAKRIKRADPNHPVAICNGDTLFIEVLSEECKDVDILGINAYRGTSFTDLFQTVREKFDKPILFTEFGADAFNAITCEEDQKSQAYYLLENWREIYENKAGLGKHENSIGGFTFQFSDGWWKYNFDHRKNVTEHDTIATWTNGGYSIDLAKDKKNMNEEWFGICAKGPTDQRGLYDLYPRAAYYVLQQIHKLNLNEKKVTIDYLHAYFDSIHILEAISKGAIQKQRLHKKKNKERFPPLSLSDDLTPNRWFLGLGNASIKYPAKSFKGTSFEMTSNPKTQKKNSAIHSFGVSIDSLGKWVGRSTDPHQPIQLENKPMVESNAYLKEAVSILLRRQSVKGSIILSEIGFNHFGDGWKAFNFIFSLSKKYDSV